MYSSLLIQDDGKLMRNEGTLIDTVVVVVDVDAMLIVVVVVVVGVVVNVEEGKAFIVAIVVVVVVSAMVVFSALYLTVMRIAPTSRSSEDKECPVFCGK